MMRCIMDRCRRPLAARPGGSVANRGNAFAAIQASDDLRRQARAIRAHALGHLDELLIKLSDTVERMAARFAGPRMPKAPDAILSSWPRLAMCS